MPSRRPHHKSRHGCLNCKQRRVKCDEKRPRCMNCVNRNLNCRFPSSLPLTWIGQTSSPDSGGGQFLSNSHQSGLETTLVNPPELTVASFISQSRLYPATEREALTLHWFKSTIYTAAHDESTLDKGQRYVTREALSHEFLMHGILAFAALHIAHSTAGKEQMTYLKTAVKYHNQGLSVFRGLLHNVGLYNRTVIIAFSALTLLFTFGYLRQRPLGESFSPIDDIVEVFLLARGSHTVLKETNLWNPLGEVLRGDKSLSYNPRIAASPFKQLQRLNYTLHGRDSNPDAFTYDFVIQNLESTFERFSADENNYHIPMSWAVEAPNRYLILLKTRDPLALVILGHYCVMLHRLRHLWWLQDWGTRVLQAIRRSTDHSWAQYLLWPLEQTRLI